jgi:serine/threonine protein kinase/Flp pilus assembly protein TadD
MTPELRARLTQHYQAALEMPADQRAQFIAKVCKGNNELKNEFEALLAANHDHADLPDTPPINVDAPVNSTQHLFVQGELIDGRFKIVRLLGTGGMGEVYEALDLELGRVALKTIRPSITGTPQQLSRFKKEVQLARRVSSPHVCRIHELHMTQSGADAPRNAFLTMEFLDGITLADKVRDSGSVPWREAKRIAVELCQGLQSIHEAGVIHRDLKGRNIMLALRNGKPCTVLMDFGIAHQLTQHSGDTSTALTRDGAFVGTPDYMAPEQFAGGEVTPATDVYALGLVLYEALTGKRPFVADAEDGAYTGKAKHLVRASSMQPGVPKLFDRVIARCLEYDPKRRYPSARAVEQDLGGGSFVSWIEQKPLLATACAAAVVLLLGAVLLIPAVSERVRGIFLSSSEKHIAVLPFEVAGTDPNTRALGDGLMDSLAGKLSNLDAVNKTLWVVPAQEVRLRKVIDPVSAMREFGATIVIEGSFERSNDVAHLKLTLIDPAKTRAIGYIDLENSTGDLAGLLDEAVTRAGRLMNISIDAPREHDTSGPAGGAAYEDYLAGIGYFARFDKPGNIDLAIAALQKAVAKDPRFALGLARLAQVYTMKYRFDSNQQSLQRAEEYCRQAAELNDNLPSTYVALASVHLLTGRHEMAVEEYQHAIELDPRDAEAVSGLANSYMKLGRVADAEAEFIKAASLRPDDWGGYNELGTFYDNLGRHNEAVAQYLRALQLTPDNAGVYENLGVAYSNSDDPNMVAKAEAALKKSIELNPSYYAAYADLAFLYAGQHRFQESIAASKMAEDLEDKDHRNDKDDEDYNVPVNLMIAYEWLKDTQKADAAGAEATEMLQHQVGIDAENAEAEATLAALFAKTGAREKSLHQIHISLALSPKNGYVLGQVADAYELMGDRKNAIVYLRQAMAHGLSRLQVKEDPEIQPVLQDPHFKSQNLN